VIDGPAETDTGDAQSPGGLSEWEPDWAEPELPNSRHGARCLALQALYWRASSPDDEGGALENLSRRSGLEPEYCSFAAHLVEAVNEHSAELSQLIEKAAHNWSLERMARLDGLILRLALAEILHVADVPPRVSIDEAVELTKAYCGESSYAFVNGILDAVASGLGVEV
jgi:N utilization substance protein B